jgi:hypothetical protein
MLDFRGSRSFQPISTHAAGPATKDAQSITFMPSNGLGSGVLDGKLACIVARWERVRGVEVAPFTRFSAGPNSPNVQDDRQDLNRIR